MTTHHLTAFVRKLDAMVDLTSAESHALYDLPVKVERLAAQQDCVRDGEESHNSVLILEGFAVSSKLVADGRR